MQRVSRADLDDMVVAVQLQLPFKVQLDHDATGYRLFESRLDGMRTELSPRLTPKDMLLWLRAYHMGLMQGKVI